MRRWLCGTYLHRGENHAGVRMLELRHDTFAYVLALPLVRRLVACKCTQNLHSSPFGAFIQRNKEFVQNCRSNVKGVRGRARKNGGSVNIG